MGERLEPARAERRLQRIAMGLTGGFVLLGLRWGGDFALAVAAGGALALLNYGAIAWMVEGFVRRPSRRARWLAAFGLGARYLLLGLALYVIFAIWRANVLAVSLGLSAPVAAIFVEWGIETYEELGPKS